MGFELRYSVDMVLGAPVGYSLGYSINMLLGLILYNYFGTWKGSLVVISFGPLDGLMIYTKEGSLVSLLLVLPRVSPFEFLNPIITGIIIGMSLVNPLGSLLESILNIN